VRSRSRARAPASSLPVGVEFVPRWFSQGPPCCSAITVQIAPAGKSEGCAARSRVAFERVSVLEHMTASMEGAGARRSDAGVRLFALTCALSGRRARSGACGMFSDVAQEDRIGRNAPAAAQAHVILQGASA